MSASLVGSEMCIRDSPHPPEARFRRARRPVSSSTSESACEIMLNRPDEACLLYTSDAADDM
eukprot:5337448-Alexandrium_andersonii.AAC.1